MKSISSFSCSGKTNVIQHLNMFNRHSGIGILSALRAQPQKQTGITDQAHAGARRHGEVRLPQ